MAKCYLRPTGDGSEEHIVQEYPSGHSHWTLVDDHPGHDSASTFVKATSGSAQRDLYATDSLPSAVKVNSVKVTGWADEGGGEEGEHGYIEVSIKYDGTVSDQGELSHPENWETTSYTWTTKPGGGEWGTTDLAGLEIGLTLRETGDGWVKCTKIEAEIDYDPPFPIITVWTGTLANIPDNWELCDGNSGRPNLLDKFVKGVGSAEEPGGTGGNEAHTHTISAHGVHTHNVGSETHSDSSSGGNPGKEGNVDYESHPAHGSGTSSSGNHVPPYYTVAYIMSSQFDLTVKENTILMWSGAVGDVPSKFNVCDGTGGTPNLVNKFIRGVPNGSANPGSTGGSSTHNHTITACGNHNHHLDSASRGGAGSDVWYAGYSSNNGSHNHTVDSEDNEPPCYKVMYIQASEDVGYPELGICMWSGSMSGIPENFQLCDGTNGTQDLRSRFVKGTSSSPGTAGSTSHSHGTNTDGSHSHSWGSEGNDEEHSGHTCAHTCSSSGSHSHTLSSKSVEPPYYKLAYIASLTTPPTFSTLDATEIAPTSAKLHGEVTDDQGLTITQRGFDYTDEQGNWKWEEVW
jgi:hypothetical protein